MINTTLIDLVQEVMSAIESDEVNSVSDTVESEQVAYIIKNVYEDFVTQKMIPEMRELTQLEALGDSSRPNFLRLPDNVKYMEVFKYKDEDGYFHDVKFEPQEDFIKKVTVRDSTESTVDTVTDINSNVQFYVTNDQRPTYWTSFDDEYIVCNSYDSDVESTLQATNTLAWVVKYPPDFQFSDDFEFEVDPTVIPLLRQEAISMAFALLKSSTNQKVEQAARRNRRYYQNDKFRTERKSRLQNYGR